LLLQVKVILVAEESNVKVKRVVKSRAGNVDVAARVWVSSVVANGNILLLWNS
jgi:hypothetical protein